MSVFWKENVSFIAICKHCGYFAWGTSKEQEKLESTHALLTSLSKPAVDPSRWLSLALIHSAPWLRKNFSWWDKQGTNFHLL